MAGKKTEGEESPEARVRRLLEKQSLCVLCTSGEEGPHASLVAFAAVANLRQMVFATPKATRKYRNLKRDPRVSLLVDDRSRAAKGFEAGSALTVAGKAREAAGAERAEFLGRYRSGRPNRDGLRGRDVEGLQLPRHRLAERRGARGHGGRPVRRGRGEVPVGRGDRRDGNRGQGLWDSGFRNGGFRAGDGMSPSFPAASNLQSVI
ncbi:MAG: pyridoxamine 5'-phosphate oxidase family protein [Planctomycetes bacterium]|nr:pyridoxamine 5'-phosphate oxidase family protein [Planctomycetota bacterium]